MQSALVLKLAEALYSNLEAESFSMGKWPVKLGEDRKLVEPHMRLIVYAFVNIDDTTSSLSDLNTFFF